MTATAPALGARGISKRFPGVIANEDVTFDALSGEVHALLGENGSGKTTLCKILTGLLRPDAGHVLVDGHPRDLSSPRDAYEAGIFMVHQHFSLISNLTVAENVVLGWSPDGRMRLSPRTAARAVAEAAERFHVAVEPDKYIWQLSLGERQRVEILKALYRGARTLILDEPTTVLTPSEVDQLFSAMRRLTEEGGTVIFISHKMPEVLRMCDRITVLRHGRVTGVAEVDEALDVRALARLMVGYDLTLSRRAKRHVGGDEVILELDRLQVRNEFGRVRVSDVSLSVRAGEIVAIVGVSGNGQRELASAVGGVQPCDEGSVSVAGRRVRSGDPSAAIAAGLAYVPEDRFGEGLASELPISDNLILKEYRRAAFSRGFFLRAGRVRERARELTDSFQVKGRPDTVVRQLSGGNAQKVMLARELSSAPKVMLVAAPTRGLDVGAIEQVRRLLIDAAAEGVAVLLISEDVEEALDLADRIAVMYDGRLVDVLDVEDADPERLGLMMAGVEA